MPTDREPFHVRSYRDGDEQLILDLFARAFHHRRSLARWQWEYRDNPYGNRRISLAFDAEGRLAAHYAGYPVRFWNGSGGAPSTWLAHQVGDTMTAPEARGVGRGASSALARTLAHFYATFCAGQVDFNYGTNTGKIQRFSRRLANARLVEPVPFRVRALDRPWPVPGRLALAAGGWRVEPVERWDEPFDDLWRRARGAYGLLVERDARYLAWRYGACPDALPAFAVYRRRRLVGWSVFRRLEGGGEAGGEGGATTTDDRVASDRVVWGDALFDPRYPQAIPLLLDRALAAAPLAGAATLEGWLTPRPAWWGERVDQLGFEHRPEPQDLGAVYVPFRVDPGEALARNLYSMKGDSDLL